MKHCYLFKCIIVNKINLTIFVSSPFSSATRIHNTRLLSFMSSSSLSPPSLQPQAKKKQCIIMSTANNSSTGTCIMNNNNEDDDDDDDTDSSNSNANSLHYRKTTTHYVNRIVCPKCHGEGKVKSRLTKKAKFLKRMQNDNDSNHNNDNGVEKEQQKQQQMISMKHCNKCSGTGLIINPNLTSDKDDDHNHNHAMNKHNIKNKIHVGIVGGGIGGLALALALQHRAIPFTIYEKDNCFEERKQGYGLTMQQGSQALLSLGLFHEEDDDDDGINSDELDELKNHSVHPKSKNKQPQKKHVLLFGKGVHSKRHLVHEPNGEVIGSWGMKIWGRPKSKQGRDAKRQNAHIQRQELRRLLYDQIVNKEARIKWGHKFLNYSHVDDEYKSLSMTFKKRRDHSNGNDLFDSEIDDVVTYTSTVLVGADGIHSVVRSQKIGEHNSPLRYLGCIVILGITSSPQSSSLTSDGETVFQTADGETRMYAMPFAKKGYETAGAAKYFTNSTSFDQLNNGETMWQLSFPMTEEDAKALSSKGPSELKKEAMKRCGSWHDPIPDMLITTPKELISGYPVYDREILEARLFRLGDARSDDDGSDRVTMIGDAAHPMSPFKGQGANQALLDAVLLARTLFDVIRQWKSRNNDNNNDQEKASLENALGEFEGNMLERSAAKVKASADAAQLLHSDIAITKGNITRAAAIKRALSSDQVE